MQTNITHRSTSERLADAGRTVDSVRRTLRLMASDRSTSERVAIGRALNSMVSALGDAHADIREARYTIAQIEAAAAQEGPA